MENEDFPPQKQTIRLIMDARDIPREVKDVLSDRIRSHEKDRQRDRQN